MESRGKTPSNSEFGDIVSTVSDPLSDPRNRQFGRVQF